MYIPEILIGGFAGFILGAAVVIAVAVICSKKSNNEQGTGGNTDGE